MARTHVVMADDVLVEIDKVAGRRGRSRFLEDAARERLLRLDLERALRSTAGIIRPKNYPHWRDARTTRAWVRRARRAEKI